MLHQVSYWVSAIDWQPYGRQTSHFKKSRYTSEAVFPVIYFVPLSNGTKATKRDHRGISKYFRSSTPTPNHLQNKNKNLIAYSLKEKGIYNYNVMPNQMGEM
uniref:Uncharacterized protein n=1 Tax=Sphaerodactylus townsendi TaxID=933632 RepID=A0ACB8G0A3_9SAUR